MTEIVRITLENEMDLIVAHKRMISIGEYLKLSLSTQTTLATAIVEVSREVIDMTDTGYLIAGIAFTEGKYFLGGTIHYTGDVQLSDNNEGVAYAKKLVPECNVVNTANGGSVTITIGLPRSIRLSPAFIQHVKEHFKDMKPATPYEELKARNVALNKLAIEKDKQLEYTRYLDEKKNEFISTASHELKTPLTTIMAFSQILLSMSQQECSPQVRTFIEKIHNQSSKLKTLIQQLLDISKIEAGRLEYNKEPINFFNYTNEIVNTLRLVHPTHHITLTEDNSGDLVYADKLRIEQVFANLVSNAAKYSKAGSTITIHVSSDNSGMQKVAITDHGIGISAKNLQAVFNKFYREEQVYNKIAGLGIGLFITKGIVEEHGGSIWVESKEGEGSTFTFTIPVLKLHL